jgi:hypothetical protein
MDHSHYHPPFFCTHHYLRLAKIRGFIICWSVHIYKPASSAISYTVAIGGDRTKYSVPLI